MVLEPGRRVHQVGEAHRVALGEAVVGERRQLHVDLIGHRPSDAPLGHALVQPATQPLHALGGPLGPHGLAELVGLGRAEPGHVDGHLHELLLEQRHPQGLGQRPLQQGVQVGDRLLAVAAPDVGVHRPALDRTRSDQRHLHHQVVERAGPQPGQGGHLGPGLHLEHPHRIGPAQHLVDRGVLGQGGQVDVLAAPPRHQVDHVVQGAQHAQSQQVELHQPHGRAVVLVPLEHAAIGHAGPLHRAHLDHRPVAHHHPPGVDAQVPGEVLHLPGQLQHLGGDLVVGPLAGLGLEPLPRVELLGPGVLLARVGPQGLGHVAHRGAGPVGDHVGHLGRVVTAVAPVDVLDHLLPAAALDVEVDVWRPVPLGRQEPLEQQAQAHGVDLGDAQRPARRTVGGRPPTLAVDVVGHAEPDDVPHDQEVAGEPQLVDHRQLVVDLGPRLVVPALVVPAGAGTVAVGPRRPLLHQTAQERHLGQPVGTRVRRQVRGHQTQVERARPAQLRGRGHHPRVAGEPAGLLGPRPQVGPRPARQPPVGLLQAAPRPHRGQGHGQPPPGRGGVVHVVGGHQPHAPPHRQVGQGVVAGRVERVAVVPQLHVHRPHPERLHQTVQLPGRGRRTPGVQGGGHRPLPPTGEHGPTARRPGRRPTCRSSRCRGQRRQLVQGEARRPLLPRQLRRAQRPGQPGVALGPPGQHHQRRPLGRSPGTIGSPYPLTKQRHLGPEHRGQAHRPGGLGEAHHPVEAVAVGDRQRLQPQPHRLLHQLLGVRRPLQEAEVGVAVELGVGHGGGRCRQPGRRLVGLAPAGPGRTVAPVRPLGPVARPIGPCRRCGRAGEATFQLRPRHRRVVEAHPATLAPEHLFGQPAHPPLRRGSPRRRSVRPGTLPPL